MAPKRKFYHPSPAAQIPFVFLFCAQVRYFGHFAPPKLERYAREVNFCAQAAAKKSHVAPCGIEDLVSLGARRRLPAAPWKIVVNFCAQAAEIMLVAFATLARFARFGAR